MMPAYYNEFDPFAAQWIENLAASGHVTPGTVDRRSITEVTADDVRGFDRVHLFAGIAGWELALQLAGWPVDVPVWTGSCPCQPFSVAGRRQAEDDERHLWPELMRLIREASPPVVFGEQVASSEVVGSQLEAAFAAAVQAGDYALANRYANRLVKSGSLGESMRWVDGIRADLESAGYTVWVRVLGAHSVSAPHRRQRLYWVARLPGAAQQLADAGHGHNRGEGCGEPAWRSEPRLEGHAACDRRNQRGTEPSGRLVSGGCGDAVTVGDAARHDEWRLPVAAMHGQGIATGGSGGAGDTSEPRLEGHAGHGDGGGQSGRLDSIASGPVASAGAWSDFRIVHCRDGKARRVSAESEFFPLVAGIPRDVGRVFPELAGLAKGARENRNGRLKGYGNAIVPQVAAEFIRAAMDQIISENQTSKA